MQHATGTRAVDLDAIAREMMAAQDEVRQIAPFSSRIPGFGNDAAYAVARIIHDARVKAGWVPRGRKIGFTNPVLWDQYGVREPIWGHVYDRTVVMSSGSPITCRLGRHAEPRIEPEIVVHFRSAPAPAMDLGEILACIDWIAGGFEIVQSHFPGWSFRAADTIADGGLHAALLVGEPREVRKLGNNLLSDLETVSVSLWCGGECRERGKGSNVMGSPLAAVKHLLGVLASQPHAQGIQAGEMVTTGTLTPALPVLPGETWHTEFQGLDLPGIAVAFEH